MKGGRVHRGALPADGYVQIENAWLRDRRLSFRARGILAMLASHREGWVVPMSDMVTDSEKVAAIRTAVRELETLGYLRRERVRNANGSLGGADWFLQSPASDDRA